LIVTKAPGNTSLEAASYTRPFKIELIVGGGSCCADSVNGSERNNKSRYFGKNVIFFLRINISIFNEVLSK
jgi:hypothetical protein